MERGSHMTNEQKAHLSVMYKGKPGLPATPETRAKQSAALMGHAVSLEVRKKISVTLMGHPQSPESRAKNAAAHMGELNHRWTGGSIPSQVRHNAKRRTLSWVYLNAPFPGCEGHHVDGELVINMPKPLHRSIYHRQSDGRGMAQINAIAYNFLFKQEVEAIIGGNSARINR